MQSGKRRFPRQANEHFRYPSSELLVEDREALARMIQTHKKVQVPRLWELEDYYRGDNQTILRANRRRESHLADHRATHNFAKYITSFIQGYMIGVPLKTSYPDDSVNEIIRDINRQNDADEHNSNLVLDCSIYGRAYELLYRDRNDKTRFTVSDVRETFVIYDDTVEMHSIAAVRYTSNAFNDGTVTVQLYTDRQVYTYRTESIFDEFHEISIDDHHFGSVPIVEYQNNKFRQGDFEDVLSLIDLYDEAQADTANYMTDFNDAMLKITGNLDLDVEDAKKMKENNILFLRTEPSVEGNASRADADYIYKQYDVQGTESYKTRLFNDILLFASIPNLLDNKFSGNQTGEALKMKLFGLSQKRAIKERLFKKSLRDRYRLIRNMMVTASEGDFDVNDIVISFTENLPKSVDKELEWFAKLGGKLSDETLLSLLSFVANPAEELEKIKNEAPSVDYDFEREHG
ncbi:phage portal protein [Bacillus sp. FSL W7-1360]